MAISFAAKVQRATERESKRERLPQKPRRVQMHTIIALLWRGWALLPLFPPLLFISFLTNPPPHPTSLFLSLFVCAICPLSRRNVSAQAAECGEQIGGRAWTMEHASLLGHSSSLLGTVGGGAAEKVILWGDSQCHRRADVGSECAEEGLETRHTPAGTKVTEFDLCFFFFFRYVPGYEKKKKMFGKNERKST